MFRSDGEGVETTLQVVGAGGLLGCAALFLGAVFPASARAVVRSEVVAVPGAVFLDLIERRRDLSRRFIGALAMRLNALADTIESRGRQGSVARLEAWLRARTGGAPGGVVLGSTKKALAEELGMAPETLSRGLGKLARAGAIRIGGRRIEVVRLSGGGSSAPDMGRGLAEAGAQ